ncbi:hypothetical protein [Pandoraea communis]|uniref:2-nitropropane dioxygenase n=1 Tax=Pandoraea communis TaxID=2508297 RepID=A0A5E4UMX1_9BURK|nr:hypothetical protein [Pandoraea communis]MDM8355562.1 hypothetical protein [Pandoraea communis]VVE00893.1 2-nitropropane dioxygenase [Pandoraea communis]
MTSTARITRRLGMSTPIIQAPMAMASTPALMRRLVVRTSLPVIAAAQFIDVLTRETREAIAAATAFAQ